MRFRDGADAALASVRDRCDVGLITHRRRETQRGKLEALGIADAFDVAVYCSPEDGIASKPAPEPFETALSELSTTPERAVMVGDSLPEDVAGARAAGLRSVWTPVDRPHEDLPADPDPAPTHRVDSAATLRSVL